MNKPDNDWLPFLKLAFGFTLLLCTSILAAIIALGRVEEHTSYGLPYILGSLSTMSGGFAQWAFAEGMKKLKERE